ncbi:MAG: polysaccharide deacetylase family protein [Rhodocyclaceae bacterium]|nr:polysaccharide deacetylase family protein [Rhodocyclaceae bacterium]
MIVKQVLKHLSPAGRDGKLSIFIFHRVLDRPDPLFPGEPDRACFDQMMGWISGWFNVLALDDAVEQLKTGQLPARAAAITFDDGYADNWLNAVPILKKHRLTATFFIATGYLDGGRMWNDTVIESIRNTRVECINLDWLDLGVVPLETVENRRAAVHCVIPAIKHLETAARMAAVDRIHDQCKAGVASDLMLTTDQLKQLSASGMGVGAHTVTHPILARLSLSDAKAEMSDSRDQLEAILGQRVGLFAYPNGKLSQDYTREHADLARQLGFDAAVSTNFGASGTVDDVFQLRRFTPWDRTRARFAARLCLNLKQRYA